MEFWFYCNSCARRPESCAVICTFRLTNCGHILCSQCVSDTGWSFSLLVVTVQSFSSIPTATLADTVKVCKFCNRREILTHPIDKTLPTHIRKFFLVSDSYVVQICKYIFGFHFSVLFMHAFALTNLHHFIMSRCISFCKLMSRSLPALLNFHATINLCIQQLNIEVYSLLEIKILFSNAVAVCCMLRFDFPFRSASSSIYSFFSKV